MTQEQVVEAWLNDTQKYNALANVHNSVIDWAHTQCKWPEPISLKPSPGKITASRTP